MSKQKEPLETSSGHPFPLGAHYDGEGINFALFSRHATRVTLVVCFMPQENAPQRTQEFYLDPALNRTSDIWHIKLHSGPKKLYYGYKIDGPNEKERGLFFSPETILIDPYAQTLAPRVWGEQSFYGEHPVCVVSQPLPFDWQEDRPLNLPAADTIIYELHVRGFTRHHSSLVHEPGTFLGIIEKIPYLKELGITAVELLPITEWDETDNRYINPFSGTQLFNYWGYNPLSFFALKTGYSSVPGDAINEFKLMVRSLHQAGIEVILDMVYNHTGEIDYDGKTTCFRGIDNSIYYMLDHTDGSYLNFSGCGNTVNCNHPIVIDLIRASLHYWVSEMHVDGFRFDLASIFSRNPHGEIVKNPPLVELIAEDPLLSNTKIIAEAWDASGLYQVGSFSKDARWREWNGRFRDDLRLFMSGQSDTIRSLATRIAGSSDLYQQGNKSPQNSINFLTSHDGFTLYDLVSYNEKNNHANGEQNRDGENHNLSWNSGHEGIPCPQKIEQLRHRRIRTFMSLLLFSQGIPMITAGDEFARTQNGNNNSWCQDNDIGWIDWSLCKKNHGLLRFCRKCIALRQKHSVFKRSTFFRAPTSNTEKPEITWQSLLPGSEDWSSSCHTLAFTLHRENNPKLDNTDFFIMVNGHRDQTAHFFIPDAHEDSTPGLWLKIIDTSAPPPHDFMEPAAAGHITPGSTVIVPPMGLITLQSVSGDDHARQTDTPLL